MFLLILAGDVEVNPGPDSDITTLPVSIDLSKIPESESTSSGFDKESNDGYSNTEVMAVLSSLREGQA